MAMESKWKYATKTDIAYEISVVNRFNAKLYTFLSDLRQAKAVTKSHVQ